jgi:DNA-binding CsgD family transcriptional regulator
MLAPHMRRALNAHRALCVANGRIEALRQSVEALDVAVVALDRSGRVVRMSTAAEAILNLRRGIELDNGYLRASVPSEQIHLTAIIAGAVATGTGRGAEFAVPRSTGASPESGSGPLWTPSSGGAMVVSRWPPNRPLRVVVTPFHSSDFLLNDQPAALAFLSDPEAKPGSRATVLGALYGLTPTECRVADLLTSGCELNSAADRMKMTFETARFHLKSIFRKTGVCRQQELIRLVLGLPSV